MHDDEVAVGQALVRRLLGTRMPGYARLPIVAVEPWGTDNAIWRLGDDLVVRLPRIHWAVGQVELEARWLPRLAPHLPIAVPEPVAVGGPAHGYPFPWAVHRWIPGEGASPATVDDAATLARSRGAAINQACAALPYYLDTYPLIVERSWHKLAELGVARLSGD
jgi:aminoglycoside phosphotransferase (APT) family kinase protein